MVFLLLGGVLRGFTNSTYLNYREPPIIPPEAGQIGASGLLFLGIREEFAC
jgi:hypothetical protein